MSFDADQAALITGAASGIGEAVAAHLASAGVGRLELVDRDAEGRRVSRARWRPTS